MMKFVKKLQKSIDWLKFFVVEITENYENSKSFILYIFQFIEKTISKAILN